MSGSCSPSSGRCMVVTKSPLTGLIACAGSGGIWGVRLKLAGWDALIVEGQGDDRCCLIIADDKIEISDAREYLGFLSKEPDDRLKGKHAAPVLRRPRPGQRLHDRRDPQEVGS